CLNPISLDPPQICPWLASLSGSFDRFGSYWRRPSNPVAAPSATPRRRPLILDSSTRRRDFACRCHSEWSSLVAPAGLWLCFVLLCSGQIRLYQTASFALFQVAGSFDRPIASLDVARLVGRSTFVLVLSSPVQSSGCRIADPFVPRFSGCRIASLALVCLVR